MTIKDLTHQDDRIFLSLDAPLSSVIFSPLSVRPLELRPSSRPIAAHCPFSSQCGHPTSQVAPHEKGPNFWAWCVHVVQSHLHYTPPPASAPSQPLHSIMVNDAQILQNTTFSLVSRPLDKCSLCQIWSVILSSLGWLTPSRLHSNAPTSWKPSLTSLFWIGASSALTRRAHLVYFITLFHTLLSSPLYLPSSVSKLWAPWRQVLMMSAAFIKHLLCSRHPSKR